MTSHQHTRRTPARTRLLDAANELFYREGMNATGIDTITTHAGVARKSLYNNFTSKDQMQLAYVEKRHQDLLHYFHTRLPHTPQPDARDAVAAMFDSYADHARETLGDGFRGCGILNAASEVPAGSTLRAAVRGYKEEIEAILATYIPADLAQHLSFLLEGAMVRSGLEESIDSLLQAKDLALSLVDNSVQPSEHKVNK